MVDDRTIFDEPHHQSLEFLAAQALSDGNVAAAFKLADRRCRILPAPEPHCYVLRGEAFFQMGATAAAIADIAKALEIAPDNIAANRRMLAWAKRPQQKKQAAFALIGHENNFESLRIPIRVLRKSGQRNFTSVAVFADTIVGWAIWEDETPLTISIMDEAGELSAVFEPDPFHPFAEYGHATDFVIKRAKSTVPQSILLSAAGNVFYSTRTAGNEAEAKPRVHWPRPKSACDQRVTIIVPVYDDYESTRHCLETLLDELRASHHRAILVDDATPNPQIAKYLAKLGTESHVEVLINPRNIGFIGSVNRALAQIKQDDVILLNSDTIVPPDIINRLAAAAHSSPDIGTVTPLSNNGEFASFPIPNTSNPICSREEIIRIDSITAQTNSERIVDIPCGIGFCLYVTRACLDAVGPLSEDFDAGYLEDADFCLRGREHGFRSVCAPSVYVGHAGSKSFGQQKRSLVVRNLSVLEQRFPKHRSECAAFMVADPLRTAREAIERTAAAIVCHPRLLVTGAGTIAAIARQRAHELASGRNPVMVLEVRNRVDGPTVKIFNAAGGMPQSTQFNLASSSECDSLADFLRSMRPSRIEILDPAKVTFRLVDLLLSLKVPYDIFIADSGLIGADNTKYFAAAVVRSLGDQKIDGFKTPPKPGAELESEIWVRRWREIAGGAQQILAPCPQAKAYAANVLPKRRIDIIGRSEKKRRRAMRKREKGAVQHLGLLSVRCCAHEQFLMSEIARRLNRIRPAISITIIGATLDDIGLMRSGNTFVTGAVSPEEIEREVECLGLRYLFVSATQPLFGHPVLSVVHSLSYPAAYFDWSKGRVKPKKNNLPIDPSSSLDDIIGALDGWMPVL